MKMVDVDVVLVGVDFIATSNVRGYKKVVDKSCLCLEEKHCFKMLSIVYHRRMASSSSRRRSYRRQTRRSSFERAMFFLYFGDSLLAVVLCAVLFLCLVQFVSFGLSVRPSVCLVCFVRCS